MANEQDEAPPAARSAKLPEQGILVLRKYDPKASLGNASYNFEKHMAKIYRRRGPGLGEARYNRPSAAENARLMQQIREDVSHTATLVHIGGEDHEYEDNVGQLVQLMNEAGMTVWKMQATTATTAYGKVYPPPQEGKPYTVTITLELPATPPER